jgi:hypothetical protein
MESGDAVQCRGDCRWSAVPIRDGRDTSRRSQLPLIGGQGDGASGTLTGYYSSWPPPPLYGAAWRGPATPVGGLPWSGSRVKGPVDHPLCQLVEINTNNMGFDGATQEVVATTEKAAHVGERSYVVLMHTGHARTPLLRHCHNSSHGILHLS